jgi:hypothetical protein
MVSARMRWAIRGASPGGCAGQALEPHLRFQVREDALDHEPVG